MTHETVTFDDIFHQTNFEDSLQYIPNTLENFPFPSSIVTSSNAQGIPTSFLSTELVHDVQGASSSLSVMVFFDSFLAQYSIPQTPGPTGTSKSFTNFSDFRSALLSYLSANSTSLGSNANVSDQDGLYKGLLKDFATAMGIQLDSNGNVVSGDWSILNTNPPVQPPLNFSNPDNSNNPFIQTFNHFLSEYQYPQSPLSSGGTFKYATYFINQFHAFLGGTATLRDPSQAYVNPTASNQSAFDKLSSYYQIYQGFGPPNATPEMFTERLKQFYQERLQKNGYFLPSQAFSEWVTEIRNENNLFMNIELIGSSLAENDSSKVQILNRLILLLISLISTLQNVGVAQANRLQFLTQYQQVYTTLQTQVPVFLKDASPVIGGGSQDAGTTRNDLNSSFNGILIDNLRALRSIQEDNAKKLQSNINQTNDAVNQQTDMATTFLQQMSTLLAAIFR